MHTDNIDFQHGDSLELMKQIPDGSIDCILTDPPYKYLKHKLDRDWDEDAFFAEFKRVLKPKGMIAIFGRGTAFYRWNVKLDALGFPFKEEIVWDKRRVSSSVAYVSRMHETISISGNGVVRKSHVPYSEVRSIDLTKVSDDLKMIREALRNEDAFSQIDVLLRHGKDTYPDRMTQKHHISMQYGLKQRKPAISIAKSVAYGFVERDIVSMSGVHYKSIHPTEKPVRLLERIMALISDEGDTVLDPFAGSASTAIAALNTGRKFIGYEIDDEYFALASKRLEEYRQQPQLEM